MANETSGHSSAGTIYVNDSAPATLHLAETSAVYSTLREARAAWLALPHNVKKDASITTDENGGACYRGWEMYRLWAR
jgi:hypothetical protein